MAASGNLFAKAIATMLSVALLLALTSIVGASGTTEPESKKITPSEDVDELRQSLKDPRFPARMQAYLALEKLGPRAVAAVPDLLSALAFEKSEYGSDRIAAISALRAIGRDALAPVLQAYRGGSERQRAGVLHVLGSLYRPGDTQLEGVFVDALGGPSEELRFVASGCVAVSQPMKPALPYLLKIIRDPSETLRTRRSAAGALRSFGPDARPAVATLQAVLADRTNPPSLRAAAAFALGGGGGDARQTVPLLLTVFSDRSKPAQIRAAALHSLGSTSTDDPQMARLFAQTLADVDEDLDVRTSAAGALRQSRFGDTGGAALLRVAEAKSKGASDILRVEALHAIARLNVPPGELVPVMVKLLLNLEETCVIRLAALQALAKVGPHSGKTASVIVGAVQSDLLPSAPKECGVALRECVGAQEALRVLRRHADYVSEHAPERLDAVETAIRAALAME